MNGNPEAQDPIVVVGAGQAGGWAVCTLRAEGFAGKVVLIGAEDHPPHERPPLSKGVLAATMSPEALYLATAEDLGNLAVEWRRRERVTAIDRSARRLVLEGGDCLQYSKLILCTGGRARRPEVQGIELPGVFVLRTIEDSLALRTALRSARRVFVAGGGWIGLEVAAAARAFGADVILVEAGSFLCARSLPPVLSRYLQALHEGKGVQIHLDSSLSAIRRNGDGGLSVRCADGREFHADAVVVGAGLVPNDEVAKAAGLRCENGILVDRSCRTSDPLIFAAGDVAVAPNQWAGGHRRMESWQNAQDQGIAAARASLQQQVSYDPLPWFWSDQYDVNIQVFGLPAALHRTVLRGDMASGRFVAFCMEGDKVRAAIGVNAPRDLRAARRLIERRTGVRDSDLVDLGVAVAKL